VRPPDSGGAGIRVGLFGNLCSGNLGNDGSLEAVVSYLRRLDADVRLGFFCMGPDEALARYGGTAESLQWFEPHAGNAAGLRATGLKVVGKLLDPFRTLAWVRRNDVVIVPGMGVLEATVPLRPWGFPYSLFWLGVTARLSGTRVALVSVGSDLVRARATRWLIIRAARLAHYRSFRDDLSRNSMRQMGVDVAADRVYPDLAFWLPNPPATGLSGKVSVGVMAYRGGNDDRAEADELHRHYVDTMTRFVHWLLDAGRKVRLHTTDHADEQVLRALLDDVRAQRTDHPDIESEPVSTLPELMQRIATVDTVVGSRYHNVLCALKLSKPTLSVGYAAKHDVLMQDMGLGDFSEPARSVDFGRLIAKFETLERDRDALVTTLDNRNAEKTRLLDDQFAELSQVLAAASHRAFEAPGEASPFRARSGSDGSSMRLARPRKLKARLPGKREQPPGSAQSHASPH
jgi:polysaccharide pyruvyl transferase WcaK-like protein